MVDLGQGRYRRFAPTTAGALFDRHGWRDTVDNVDFGLGSGLHELACVSIEALQITPQAFFEDNIKGNRAFTTAREPGDHAKLSVRDIHINIA